MRYDQWQELIGSIREKYEVEEDVNEVNEDGIGTCERVVFTGPGGKIMLELIKRPLRLGTKTHYSNRIGSSVAVEHEYSDTEESITLKAYRFDKEEDAWEEINAQSFS
jgi:prefoldin subunit 5